MSKRKLSSTSLLDDNNNNNNNNSEDTPMTDETPNNDNNNNGNGNNIQQQPPPPTEVVDGQASVRRSIQTDLENLEDTLGGQDAIQYTPTALASGGRAFVDSIRTALGSVRSRLETFMVSENGGGQLPNNANIATTTSSSSSSSSTMGLMNRLRQMETAFSHRIPLGQLQRHSSPSHVPAPMSPGSTSNNSETTTAVIGTPTDSTRQTTTATKPQTSHRRPSILLASRRVNQENADKELHRTGTNVTSRSTSRRSSGTVSSGNFDTDDDEHKKKEYMDIDKIDERETPILLTRSGHQRLDPAHRSVLFAQQQFEDEQEQQQHSATAVYSWGLGVNSLHDTAAIAAVTSNTDNGTTNETKHDDDVVVPLENARVDPTSRTGRNSILSAAANQNHAVLATATGQVIVCGRNVNGAVDPEKNAKDREDIEIIRPTFLESLSVAKIVQVSCGLDHTLALKSNGTVLSWGSNEFGQLGHYYSSSSGKSEQLKFCQPKAMALGGRRATKVCAGHGYSLVLTSRMALLACGKDLMTCYRNPKTLAAPGGVGLSPERSHNLPAAIPALEDLPLVSIAAGRGHAVAITAHGSAFVWGDNTYGCCGRGYPKQLAVPVKMKVSDESKSEGLPISVAKDVAIVDAACGDLHTVLLAKSGRVLVCGSNVQGQLGIVDPDKQDAVYNLEAIEHEEAAFGHGFVQATAGAHHTLLLDSVGDVWQMGGSDNEIQTMRGARRVLQARCIMKIAAGGGQSIAVGVLPGRSAPQREFSYQPADFEPPNLVDSVEELLENLSNDDHNELGNRTEELLRTPAVLNSLFLDPSDLEEFFSKLLKTGDKNTRREIFRAIENGMMRGLDTLANTNDARLKHPEQVHFLLLYLQCPLFVNWKECDLTFDRRGDVILSLCDTILSLSYEGYKALMSWATSPVYPRELFVRFILRPLLAQLSKGLSAGAGAETRPIPAVASVLRWLHSASQKSSIAEPEDFYLEDIEKMKADALLEDLMRYKRASKEQRATEFLLCNNPFLFSPRAKRALLQLENEVNMFRTAASSGLTLNIAERTLEFDPYWILEIERANLLPQTLEKVAEASATDLRKKLRVVFKGEDGVDAGGVTREFFHLLSAQLFDRSSGMWSSRFEDADVTWFNSDCFWNDNGYFLCGVLVGLAVYNSVLLDVHFPQALYRKLLGLPLGLEDMVDEHIKAGLQKLLDYPGDDVEDVFCLSFDVAWTDLGQETRRELKPGGSNIPVTSENKEEYVMLYTKFLLVDSIYPQYGSFESGFMRVMENSSLELLRPDELELLVVGTPDLDFSELEKKVEYEGGYDKHSPVIKHFWNFIKNADKETKERFLKFATGSPKSPIGGLGNLPFKIQRAGPDSHQLPSSHTCFNTLLLPDYGDNFEKLKELLSRSILECEGFGLQ